MTFRFIAALGLVTGIAAQTADVANLFRQAKSAQQSGDSDTAIERYLEILKLEPDLAPARLNLGLAYFKKGDAQHAAEQFQQLLAGDPRNARLVTLLGASYLQAGENARALEVLEPLAETAGANADFLWSYGSALIANGKLRAGVAAVEKVAKQTNSAEAWLLAGQNLLALNEFPQAKEDLEAAARVNPELPGLQTALGQAREKNADYPGAIEAYRKAIAQDAKDMTALIGLGSDLYFTRDLENARKILKLALEVDPASAPALYATALVEKAKSEPAAAVSHLEQAVKLRPDWMEAHVQLAALYFQLNRKDDGARERQIVDRISEEQRKAGPGKY